MFTHTACDFEFLRVAEIVAALSQALDLGSGSERWHSVRSCILGMRIAEELNLREDEKSDLYYALLLKDAGCSSNASEVYRALESDDIAAKRDVKTTDWTRLNWETLEYALSHVATGKPFLERVRAILRMASQQKQHARDVTAMRCERGSTLARLMGLGEGTALAIGGLDEHWDGGGNPNGRRKSEIPIGSRIMLLAQTLDVFWTSAGPDQALEVIQQRKGRWFDPDIVRAASSLARENRLWDGCESRNPLALALALEPHERTLSDGDVTLDAVCCAFAQIVDAKSPFTYNHSNGVANAAVAIARTLGLNRERVLFVRHAALLHDLGKMAVSNAVLEKPGKPTREEWEAIRCHPAYTHTILSSIRGFAELSEVASSHHEKLNGTGYHRGLRGEQLSTEARILVVADMFDALAAKRPYRDALPVENVLEILRKEAPHALDATSVEALEQSRVVCDQTFIDLKTLQERLSSSERLTEPERAEQPIVV